MESLRWAWQGMAGFKHLYVHYLDVSPYNAGANRTGACSESPCFATVYIYLPPCLGM